MSKKKEKEKEKKKPTLVLRSFLFSLGYFFVPIDLQKDMRERARVMIMMFA